MKSQAIADGFDNVHDWLVFKENGESAAALVLRKWEAPWASWLAAGSDGEKEDNGVMLAHKICVASVIVCSESCTPAVTIIFLSARIAFSRISRFGRRSICVDMDHSQCCAANATNCAEDKQTSVPSRSNSCPGDAVVKAEQQKAEQEKGDRSAADDETDAPLRKLARSRKQTLSAKMKAANQGKQSLAAKELQNVTPQEKGAPTQDAGLSGGGILVRYFSGAACKPTCQVLSFSPLFQCVLLCPSRA